MTELKNKVNTIVAASSKYIKSEEEIKKGLSTELVAGQTKIVNGQLKKVTSIVSGKNAILTTEFTEESLSGYIRTNFHGELSKSVSKLIDNSLQNLVEERLDLVNKRLKKTDIGKTYEKAQDIYKKIYESDVLLIDMKEKYTKSLSNKLSGSVSNSIKKFTSNKWVSLFVDGSQLSNDVTNSINSMVATTIDQICSNQLIVDTTRQIKDTVTTLKKSATNYLNTQLKNEIAYGKKLKSAIKDRIQLYEAKKAEYLKKVTTYINELRQKISSYLSKVTSMVTEALTSAVKNLVSGIKLK